MTNKDFTILGYSGHAYVVIEAALNLHLNVVGYCELKETVKNPYNLVYKGDESDTDADIWQSDSAILLGVGNNVIRTKLGIQVLQTALELPEIIHPDANVSTYAKIGEGSFVARGASINPFVKIGRFAIVNTGAIIDHECTIHEGVHIAPGTVLAGNVSVGRNTFIGANAVVKQGVSIGEHCIIGAGSVVLKDIHDHQTYVGNPAMLIDRR
jgi:sugar O-acyltransferase (sialic acid O-acetyltransferase NeuD family)